MSLKRKMINDKRKDDNSNNRQHFITVAATIYTLGVIIVASSMAITTAIPVAATTTPTTTGNTTATSSSGIELSAQPIYVERTAEEGITPINDTHIKLAYSGNGTLTLPNSTTQTINTTSNGTVIISTPTSSGYGKETIMTQDGEIAIATVYEIVQFNNSATGGAPKGIVTAVFQTNSTGKLAPLNGMIAAGIDDMSSIDVVTFWRWESGISSSGAAAPPPTNTNTTTQGAPSTNSSNSNATSTTTTTTNEASPLPSSPLTSLY
jgi:hypothetical protein